MGRDTGATGGARETVGRGAWTALIALTAINLVNYIDRFLVPAVQESIKRSELAPSDFQLGLLAPGFLLVYMCAAPVFGILGARFARTKIIALGLAIWSIATALAGLAPSYPALLGTRALVGVGEAAYGTLAPALLADVFPASWRNRVFAVFYMAIPVGSALGYVLGGWADHAFGWRRAFFIVGLPGLLLAAVAFALRDPGRRDTDESNPGLGAYTLLLRMPSYRRTILGYIAYTFALGGIASWMPSYLARVRDLPLDVATRWLGSVLVVTGLVGTGIGGWVADRVQRRVRRGNLWVSGVATLLAAPLAYAAFVTRDPTGFWVCLAVAEVLVFISTGPINVEIVSDVPPMMRAAAMALSIFAIHALGDVVSPPLIGYVSDHSSLGSAVLIIPAAVVVAGAVWVYAATRRDDPVT
jgi:MFS transporter, Spinster family, sphingosine-1-phosphate transporter